MGVIHSAHPGEEPMATPKPRRKYGTSLRESVLERAREEFDGVILGTQSHADYPAPEKGGRNVSAGFRIGLDLYANVRPARTRPSSSETGTASGTPAAKYGMSRWRAPSMPRYCVSTCLSGLSAASAAAAPASSCS